MPLDESETDDEEEEEGTDMESDLEQRKDEGEDINVLKFVLLLSPSVKLMCYNPQIFLMRWRGAPGRKCFMIQIM